MKIGELVHNLMEKRYLGNPGWGIIEIYPPENVYYYDEWDKHHLYPIEYDPIMIDYGVNDDEWKEYAEVEVFDIEEEGSYGRIDVCCRNESLFPNYYTEPLKDKEPEKYKKPTTLFTWREEL